MSVGGWGWLSWKPKQNTLKAFFACPAKCKKPQQNNTNPQTIHAAASLVPVVFEEESLSCRRGVGSVCPWYPCGGSCPCWLILASAGDRFQFCPLWRLYFKVHQVSGFYPKWWVQLFLNSESTCVNSSKISSEFSVTYHYPSSVFVFAAPGDFPSSLSCLFYCPIREW